MILIDAGPLVALLDADDPKHDLCRDQLALIRDSLLTAWPPVVEAMHLLRRSGPAQSTLIGWLKRGLIEIAPIARDDLSRIDELMRKYRDLPMDFADASLVRVAERERIRRIFTIDRDFAIYRPRGLGRFQILPAT